MTEIHRGSVTPAGGARIAFAQTGTGPDLILVHGAMVTREDMVLALFPSLSDRARVTAFDRPGHGYSAGGGWTGSPWRQAAALHAAASMLGLQQPVVVGHSFGSAVAIAYGLQFPDATGGVVALAPIATPELRLEHLLFGPRGAGVLGGLYNAFAKASLDRALLPVLWNAMFLPQAMPRRFAEQFPFEVAGSARQTRAEGEDALSLNLGLSLSLLNYRFCKVPVAVIIGGADKVVLPQQGRALAALIPGSRLETLPGLGHMLHHFAPDVVASAALGLAGGVSRTDPVLAGWPSGLAAQSGALVAP